MEDIGARLKAAREKLNLSREDVSRATKIKTIYIESIENNHFQNLIAPIYAKGFIKLYAQCVQIDPTPLLRQLSKFDFEAIPIKPEKKAQTIATPEKKWLEPKDFAKILFEISRKIKLPNFDKIKMPAVSPIPAPAKKWLAVAFAAGAAVVILSFVAQKSSLIHPSLKVPPACRWVADPPEPYLAIKADKAAVNR